uniref:UvrABC system protein B n=1 Tax=Zeugodacus cucurbitae TaxID=28588 RepID=A0A0A1XDA1_ZEUCU
MAKCYSSFASNTFLMFAMLRQCCLLVPVSGAVVEVTTNPTILAELATDLRIFFPDEVDAKRVEYEDFTDPISGEDEDDGSYGIADYSSVTMSATETTEEELPATTDSIVSYVLFPTSVEETYH